MAEACLAVIFVFPGWVHTDFFLVRSRCPEGGLSVVSRIRPWNYITEDLLYKYLFYFICHGKFRVYLYIILPFRGSLADRVRLSETSTPSSILTHSNHSNVEPKQHPQKEHQIIDALGTTNSTSVLSSHLWFGWHPKTPSRPSNTRLSRQGSFKNTSLTNGYSVNWTYYHQDNLRIDGQCLLQCRQLKLSFHGSVIHTNTHDVLRLKSYAPYCLHLNVDFAIQHILPINQTSTCILVD